MLSSGLIPGNTYYFAIKGFDLANTTGTWESPLDNAAVNNLNVTFALDNIPPTPTGFSAVAGGADITLNWNAVSASDLDFYAVERSTINATTGFVGISSTTLTTFVDSTVISGVLYYYRIVAVDRGLPLNPGDALRSIPTSVCISHLWGQAPPTPTSLAGTAVSTSSIQWSWTASGGASFYTLNEFPSTLIVAMTTNTSFTEGSLTPNSVVSRTVFRWKWFSDCSSASSAQTVYTLAAAPTNLNISSLGFTEVTIIWNTDGNATNTSYRIERSLDGASFLPLTNVTTDTYSDTGLTKPDLLLFTESARQMEMGLTPHIPIQHLHLPRSRLILFHPKKCWA